MISSENFLSRVNHFILARRHVKISNSYFRNRCRTSTAKAEAWKGAVDEADDREWLTKGVVVSSYVSLFTYTIFFRPKEKNRFRFNGFLKTKLAKLKRKIYSEHVCGRGILCLFRL